MSITKTLSEMTKALLALSQRLGLEFRQREQSLRGATGASQVGAADGRTVQEVLADIQPRNSTGTTRLNTGTQAWGAKILTAGQGISGEGSAHTVLTAPAGQTAITGANLVEVARLSINGAGKNAGPANTHGFYSEGWGGRLQQLVIQNMNGSGVRLKGGWNTEMSNLRITQCKTGIEFVEHEVLPGWAGSGHVIGPGFVTHCDVGIDLGKLWNPTILNMVVEYCNVPMRLTGTRQILINPWFEGNTNHPFWGRGAVVLGGRGVTYQPTLEDDLPGVSAGDAQEEGITAIGEQGIKIFRREDQPVLEITAKTGVKALRHFGNEGGSELSLQGRHLMPSATQADISSLRGYAARYGTHVSPADQYKPNHETSAVVNRASRSVDNVQGAVVIRTGVKAATPGDSTSVDRWQFDYRGFLLPFADKAYDMGAITQRVKSMYVSEIWLGGEGGNPVLLAAGDGTPETFVTAPTGSMYFQRVTTGGTWMWQKATGTGNTGWRRMQTNHSGTTAQRPTVTVRGYEYFDTTLNKPIWWGNTTWVDATGTTV